MRTRLPVLALALSLGVATPASASTQFTFLNAGTTTAFGYFVGPYNGIQAGTGNVLLNCVDFFHSIAAGNVWQANLTSLGSGAGIGTTTRFNNLTSYRLAAYLSTQFATTTNAVDIGNIQATIWNLFSGAKTPPSPTTNVWLTKAQAYVAANPNSSLWNSVYVVTDVNSFNPDGSDNANSKQEFIIVTPEPASMMLMATGLVGLGAVLLRRRRR